MNHSLTRRDILRAAALVMMTESEAKKRGAKPLARIVPVESRPICAATASST